MKSFTGRLDQGGRKGQIRRSLKKAATHEPVAWHLVVPIDPTPAEEDWFERLTSTVPFTCRWLGKTWLDSEMALRPDISRYFIDGKERQVVEMLRELQGEEAASATAPALLQRGRRLRQRLNEVDPYYSYNLSIGSGTGPPLKEAVLSVRLGVDRIDVVPKFATALEERPITGRFSVAFDSRSADLKEKFEAALDFGSEVTLPPMVVERVTLDAPGGLAADATEEVWIRLGGREGELNPPLLVELAVMACEGEDLLASVEFAMTHRTSGRRGAVLKGADPSGLLTLELKAHIEGRRLTTNISYSFRPVLPGIGLPAARWLDQLRPPNLLRARLLPDDIFIAEEPITVQFGDGCTARLFEVFAAVQEHARASFEIPDDLTADEWQEFERVALALRPEKRSFTWSSLRLELSGIGRERLTNLMATEGGALFEKIEDAYLEFRGRRLHLGTFARTFASARVANAHEVWAAFDADEDPIVLYFEPASSDVGHEWVLTETDQHLAV